MSGSEGDEGNGAVGEGGEPGRTPSPSIPPSAPDPDPLPSAAPASVGDGRPSAPPPPASPPTAQRRVRPGPVAAFLIASAFAGGAEGWLAGLKRGPLAVALAAAAMTAVVGLIVGLATWAGGTLVFGLGGRIGWFARLGARLRAGFEPQPEGPTRERWIVVCSAGLTAVSLVLASFAAAKALFPLLFNLQEKKLAQEVSAVLVVVFSALTLVLLVGFERVARAAIRAAVERLKLRMPPPLWLLWALFVVLPAFVTIVPVLRGYGPMLGRFRELVALVLLTVFAVQAGLLLPRLRPRFAAIVDLALLVGAVGLIGAYAKPSAARQQALTRAETTPVAALGARVVRAVTDFDRDGASAYFGGGDCAPSDPQRAPTKKEVPGNGIDEDCNGKDSFGNPEIGVRFRYSGALEPGQIKQYNVVWVIMETVRADHVSALGYDKPTFPYLEELAKESLLFDNAYSQASATVLSVPSMMSGIDPGAASWRRERQHPQLDEKMPLLAERLRKKKYKTGFVYDNYFKNAFLSIQRGFDSLLLAEPDNKNQNNRPRRNLLSTAKAAEFLGKVPPNDPFFLVVYYPDQHSPYTRQPDVDSSAFGQDELGDYDTELAFADQQLRALVEMLKARPAVWDNTILVINADHGEEFGDHGGLRHAKNCYVEAVHVPLLVRIPGIPAQRIQQRVALVDVVPTVLEMLGDLDGSKLLTGQSLLVPALTPGKNDLDRPIFCNITSITDKYGTFHKRALRNDHFTLMHDVLTGSYAFFDRGSDPLEQYDLGTEGMYAAEAARMKDQLEAGLTGNLADHATMDKNQKKR